MAGWISYYLASCDSFLLCGRNRCANCVHRDLEQSLPLQKRHFRKPIKIRGRTDAEEEVFREGGLSSQVLIIYQVGVSSLCLLQVQFRKEGEPLSGLLQRLSGLNSN